MAKCKLSYEEVSKLLSINSIVFTLINPGSYKIHQSTTSTDTVIFYPKNFKIVISGYKKLKVIECQSIEESLKVLKKDIL
jgi:hypothetical protein